MENSFAYEDTASKPEYHQSRKRPFTDDQEPEKSESRSRDQKRSSHGGTQSSPLVKLLIPNYAAGAIIGKGGSNIGDLQNSYGAKIRISPSREHYPGTDERIVIITGEVNQIVDMHNYVMEKVHIDSNAEGSRSRSDDSERGQKVKIIVPNSTAGLLIGRGGSAIKSLQEETKAKIVISGRDEAAVPGERIITISGNTEQRTEAARQVIVKIAPDAENMANKNLTYSGMGQRNGSSGASFGGGGMDLNQGIPGGLNTLSSVIGSLQQHSKGNQNLVASLSSNPLSSLGQSGIVGQLGLGGHASGFGSLGLGGGGSAFGSLGLNQNVGSIVSSIKTTVSIQMEIPDILVGAILGKQGKTVHEFIQFSGAKIQFSAKNDFAPGTTDRILTIQGDLNQTQIAYFLINQKIAQAENELASGLQTRR